MPVSGNSRPEPTSFNVGEAGYDVSALRQGARGSHCVLVLGHGAGAGMAHPFMEKLAAGLADVGVATLRYQFPYMERGRRAPDRPPVLKATVRAAVTAATDWAPGLPVFAGGKSMGGRMTSLAAADGGLSPVKGLIFVGFPLHAAGRPTATRGEHLAAVSLPLLFLQGTRDKLAELELLRPLCRHIGATLHVVEGADHSFHMFKRSGKTDDEALAGVVEVIGKWTRLRAGAD